MYLSLHAFRFTLQGRKARGKDGDDGEEEENGAAAKHSSAVAVMEVEGADEAEAAVTKSKKDDKKGRGKVKALREC